jgi:hypothetical protein
MNLRHMPMEGKDSVKDGYAGSGQWATMTVPARKEGRGCSNASQNGLGKSSF